MTAEIAIMNKQAVAIAADSAVTLYDVKLGQKIFPSAQKIFTLSKYHPVGIMVYGSANFMEIPWETIIKSYRHGLGSRQFAKLEQYSTDFITYLTSNRRLFPRKEQYEYAKRDIYSYFSFIKKEIERQIAAELKNNKSVSETTIRKITRETITRHLSIWAGSKQIPNARINKRSLFGRYRAVILEAKEEVFEKLPIDDRSLRMLRELAICLFYKFPEHTEKQDASGVVIAGFGTSDIFPSLKSFILHGIAENILRYKEDKKGEISSDNDASIIPFAQSEMVVTFMEGIDPILRENLDRDMLEVMVKYPEAIIDAIKKLTRGEKDAMKKKILKVSRSMNRKYGENFNKYIHEKYVHPVLQVVSVLPKSDLAAMAESFVTLTSFKRKVSMQAETVGGPIDVAVISKGDGFIWIKRKHYFAPDLNMGFIKNYYLEVQE